MSTVNLRNCREYIESFLKIRTKDNKIRPFRLNPPQERLYSVIREKHKAGKPVRIVILKSRQMGFSTLTEAIGFWMCATQSNVEGMVVAHDSKATNKIFAMARRFYDHLPKRLRPMLRAGNAQELAFDVPTRLRDKGARGLGSKFTCATAGGNDPGRGSTLQFLHLSELAFWPGDKAAILLGLMQAVPDLPGTIVIIESTANGFDEFKAIWDRAEANQAAGIEDFIPVFFAWYEMPEYRREVPPGAEWTPEELRMQETYSLDEEQLAWRRWCIQANCGGDEERFRQEYPSTPEEAFLSTGTCVFDKTALILRSREVAGYQWEYGNFRVSRSPEGTRILDYKWTPEKGGHVRILEHPQPGVPYVIGGDTSGTGSDYFAAHVIRNDTGRQVAVLHHQFGEREFAEQVYSLGRYYNDALLGVEVNYSTFPGELLEQFGYPHLYVRERRDTFTGAMVPAHGFNTNAATRPAIIDGLKDISREALENITDHQTIGEMLTFVYDDNYRPQAEAGEHDDLVMSLAITYAIRGQQTTAVRREWTRAMWQDYREASPTEKARLRREWGPPRGGG